MNDKQLRVYRYIRNRQLLQCHIVLGRYNVYVRDENTWMGAARNLDHAIRIADRYAKELNYAVTVFVVEKSSNQIRYYAERDKQSVDEEGLIASRKIA